MRKLLKKYLNKKLIIGISAPDSTLAKIFLKKYKTKFIIKKYEGNINNYNNLKKWIIKNKNINCFVNFAAIVSVKKAERYKKKTLITNYHSVKRMLNLFNYINMVNFMYFLCISSSHVFLKSKFKINENYKKKPDNYYGFSKYKMEKYILNNINKFKFTVGIARIFSFYEKRSKKSFFIKDIKDKLSNNKKNYKFYHVNTMRDFIHTDDIVNALFHMIKLKLKADFNICSGKGILLRNIIVYLNKKIKKKNINFDNIKLNHLIGSNTKILNTGWKLKKKIGLNHFG